MLRTQYSIGHYRLLLMKHFKILSQTIGPQAIHVAATRAVAQLMQIIASKQGHTSRNNTPPTSSAQLTAAARA